MQKYLSYYKRLIYYPLLVLIAFVLILSVLYPHGSQPATLLIFFFILPLVLVKPAYSIQSQSMWLLVFLAPMFASYPLFISSGTGEALAAPARYLIAGVCFLGLRQITFSQQLIFRSASISAVMTILFHLDQFNAIRANWGVGHLVSSYLLIVLLSFSLAQFYLDKNKPWWRLLAFVAIIILVVSALLTGTRGAWPAIVVVFLVQFLLLDITRTRKVVLFLIVAVLVISAARFIPVVNDRIKETSSELHAYFEMNDHANSMGYRMDLWRISIESFKESPIWGVSYQRRSEIMQSYMQRYPESKNLGSDGRSSSHNEMLNALSKKGLLGMISVLLLYLVPLVFFIKHIKFNNLPEVRYVAIAGIGMVFTMILSGITEAPLMNVKVASTYGLLLVFLHHLICQLSSGKAANEEH